MRTAARFFAETVTALGLCQSASSQTDRAQPAFEVAAVVRSMPLEELNWLVAAGRGPSVGILVRNNRVDIGFQTIGELIAAAYERKPYQVIGPEWLVKEMNPPGQMNGKHVAKPGQNRFTQSPPLLCFVAEASRCHRPAKRVRIA